MALKIKNNTGNGKLILQPSEVAGDITLTAPSESGVLPTTASNAETIAGLLTDKAVTPASLANMKFAQPVLVWSGSQASPVAIPGCPASGDCLYMVQGTGSYNSCQVTQLIGRSNGIEMGSVSSYLQGVKLSGTSTANVSTYITTIQAIWRIF